MPLRPIPAARWLAAVSLIASGAPAQAAWDWVPWRWPVFDPATWDAGCGGQRFVQAHASGPVYNFGDEGNQVRFALGACAASRGPLSLQFDGVLSAIDAATHTGSGGGRALGVGVDALLRWRAGEARRWFVEAGGGVQYAIGVSFPADGTHFQFTVIGGVGRSIAIGAGRSLDVGLRWFHISNANLLPSNSGYDSLQLTVGMTFGEPR
jgi:hypothetical protein